jgi:histidinol dehydrogenase
MAGPNHVLPTVGTARFFSPLGVDDFIKKSSIIEFDKASVADLVDDVDTFAQAESLEMHAYSARLRGEK